jgi:ornithine--oxo-acid transaminase
MAKVRAGKHGEICRKKRKEKQSRIYLIGGVVAEYFDFLAGYSALNQGHCHPRLVAAMVEQASRLALTSRAFHNDTFAEYLEYATRRFGYERLLPMNTGAEVVETAVKLARKWAYEVKGIRDGDAKIIFLTENFHGRTMTAVSASTDPATRGHFGPYVPGIVHVPFNDVAAVEHALAQPNVAAIMLEPIQGEAGVVIPDDGYLLAIRRACTKHNVLMVSDEVQSGIGRAGFMMATEYEGVRPDIVTFGKALSGGMYPVSAVLANSDIMLVIKPGQHGSTFGGNPIANKVAVEALKIIDDEQLLHNSTVRGEQLRRGLALLPRDVVKAVRGRGLMNAIVIDDRGGADPEAALRLCYEFAAQGLLAKPTHGDRVRLTPPLVISEREVDVCLEKMHAAVRSFQKARK